MVFWGDLVPRLSYQEGNSEAKAQLNGCEKQLPAETFWHNPDTNAIWFDD